MTYKFHVAVKPYFRLQQTHFRLPFSQERAAQSSWTVPALCARYKWPTGLAGGGVIGIVELGGGWKPADMTQFFASIGQPVPSITDVSVDGTKNTTGSDADYEVALDMQVAAAAYFAATGKTAVLRVYFGQDIAPCVRAAAADGCDAFSISWGAPEPQWGAAAAQDLESAIATATLGGMVVFAASGDDGSSDGGTTPTNVDLPAGCPHTVGCGGTNLTQTSEVTWPDTGGGFSTLFPLPNWQIGVGAPAPPAGLGRMVPDVASVADPNTGINIVVRGTNVVIGGTSAAAPLWAGLVAACGRKIGFITPEFYGNKTDFTDITSGGNGTYNASVGPDPCTGMGSPLGTGIAGMLGATTAPPGTTPPPVTTAPPKPTTTAPPPTTHPPQPTTTPAPGHHHHHPPHRHHGR